MTDFTNLIWRALTGPQREFALEEDGFLRYQPEVLPFAAVPEAGTVLEEDTVLQHGPVFFSDVLPTVHGEKSVQSWFPVAQMRFPGHAHTAIQKDDEVELTRAEDAEMLALTDVAFPGMFRLHTGRLGRYIGIRQEGILVAMAGERFRLDGLREISAVCTRPGFTGRGFAAHLIGRLLEHKPQSAFLHVTESNKRAIEIYGRLGFVHLRTITVMKVAPRA